MSEHNIYKVEIARLRAALKDISNRSKRSTTTYFIWKIAQEALDKPKSATGGATVDF